jgi:DNA-binding FadR family transcriptional regulator
MREAIKGLAARGLVDSRSRVGTTVRPRSQWKLLDPDVLSWTLQSNRHAKTLWELMELRLVVGPMAAQWAAERADDEEKRHIETCFERLQEAVGDREAWLRADVNYHNSILMASHNELVTNLAGTLHGVMPVRRETMCDAVAPCEAATPQALALHRVPLKAILEGDGERARGGMRAILQRGRDVMRSRVDGEASSVGR